MNATSPIVKGLIVKKLIEFIQQRQLQTGERLPAERQLCEMLQVSRPTLREAIQQLNGLGITVSRVGSGTFIQDSQKIYQLNTANSSKITDLSLQSEQDLSNQLIVQTLTPLLDTDPSYRLDVQEARIVLESGTAWYAAKRATHDDIQKIQHYYDKIYQHQSNGNREQASIADANFHLAIAEASHNVVLLQMMKNVFHLLHHNVVSARQKIYTAKYGFDTLHSQHLHLLHAICNREPEQAKIAVSEHIDFVIQQVGKIDTNLARLERSARVSLEPFFNDIT